MEQDYFLLRANFYSQNIKIIHTFQLGNLEAIWFCSKRNCRRKLLKYQEKGLCIYTPGLGRGNASTIQFLNDFEHEYETFLRKSLKINDFESMIFLNQLAVPISWKQQLQEKIVAFFREERTEQNESILRSIIRRPLATLNPLKVALGREAFLVGQLGDTLLAYDSEKQKLMPWIAHHWDVSDDFTTWTFYIRKGIQFHDGQLLTASDILSTYKNARQVGSVAAWMLADIKKMQILDEHIFQVILCTPDRFFARYLCQECLIILPQHTMITEKNWITTGPFKLSHFSEKKVVLRAFDNYFLLRPLIDQVEFWTIPNSDFSEIILPIQTKESGEQQLEASTPVGVTFTLFNLQKSETICDNYFRKAMYHLLDMEKMFKETGLEPSKLATSYELEKDRVVKKEVDLIIASLAKSQYTGQLLKIGAVANQTTAAELTWIVDAAAKYGINLEATLFDLNNSFYEDEMTNMDIMMASDMAGADLELSFFDQYFNPYLFFQRFFTPDIISEITKRLREIKMKPTYAKRTILRKQLEAWLTDNNYLIFNYHPIQKRQVHSLLKDIKLSRYGKIDFRKIWVKNEHVFIDEAVD